MAAVFLIEFTEDIQCFLDKRDEGDIVVSLRPEVSLELDIRRIPHKRLRVDYCTHEEYMKNADSCKSDLKKILSALDNAFWGADPRYKTGGIRPFEMSVYFFYIPFGTLRSEIFELDKLFIKEDVKKVRLFKSKTGLNKDMRFRDDVSVYEELVYLMRRRYGYEIDAIYNNRAGRQGDTGARKFLIIEKIAELLKRLRGSFTPGNGHSNLSAKKGRILSVNCDEISCISKELTAMGWEIQDFPRNRSIEGVTAERRGGLARAIEKNSNLLGLFEFLGVNFFSLIRRIFEQCWDLDMFERHYKSLSDYMKKGNFDIVFFSTHMSFQMETILLPLVCREQNIPYACWMHGGYGVNYRVQGYDVSDYAFGQHYFVYGEEVKNLIDKTYRDYGLLTHVAGSPRILCKYRDYKPPANKKKIITFVTAPWGTNWLHIDVDSPYNRFSYLEPSKAILELLAQYRDRYRIVIRAGTGEARIQISVIRKLLKDFGAEDMEIIDKGNNSGILFEETVKNTDLFINLWVSTPFWEECLTRADIFLMDNSDLTDAARDVISRRAFWHDNLESFTQGLRSYLDKGVFYQKSKDDSFLKSYMDSENADRPAERVSLIIEDITAGKR